MGLAVQGEGNHQQAGILGHQPEVGTHQVWGSQAVVEGSLQDVCYVLNTLVLAACLPTICSIQASDLAFRQVSVTLPL